MKIGIAAENRPQELRVILRPQELTGLAQRHHIVVEKGAGEGIGIEDSDYENIGVKIRERSEVYQCDIVVRLKEPKEEELQLMKQGGIIMSMLHLPGNPALRGLLEKYKLIAIPMEEIKDPLGRRMIEALHEAGYQGMQKGFELWGGDPSQCRVKIMGYGMVAWGAIQAAARKYASIMILNKKDIYQMEKHIPGTDILVNGINWPMEKRGKVFLITKEMLILFKPGAVICDLISNPPGQSPIQTMHPTDLDHISYMVDGVIHTSCWAWAGINPKEVSRRYSLQVAPILLDIADNGIDNIPEYIKKVAVKFL
jgi:alanine dehydrogenase